MRGGTRPTAPAIAAVAALIVFVAAIFCSIPASARDLVVYGEPTLEPALKAVGSLWRSRSGVGVHVFVAPTGLSLAQIERGARCDVIVAMAGPALEEAERRNLIDPDTKTALFRNSLVVVARKNGATELERNVGLATLLSGKRLAIADPERDAAGRYGMAALRKVGLSLDFNGKAVAVAENSAAVLTYLNENRADFGIVYATDAAGSGLKIVMPFADDLFPPIDYVAAQTADPQGDPDEFLDFLESDEARAIFQSAGLRL